METVSCNDERDILSLTCAHCSTLIRDDDQDEISKRHWQRVKSGPLLTGALVPRD